MSFAGTSILVVGGAGFVGSNLIRRLLADDPGLVLVIDNLLSSERENLPNDDRITFVERSINDDEVLESLPEDLDYVFHLATFHGNQSSIADPLADHEHNTLTTLKLCNRIQDIHSIAKVVYASAGCTVARKTFDDAEATTEETPVSLHLDSPYQMSKIFGEFYLNYFHHRSNLPCVKARFQNVYGPGEVLGAGRWRGTPATIWRNVVPTFIHRALKGNPLPVQHGGVATRDFIHVDDLVGGLVACALEGGAPEVYNLASGEETSILDLATMINEITGNPAGIEMTGSRDWDRSGKRYGSVEKAADVLGFRCSTPLVEGLRSTVAWTRNHLDFIDRCIAKHEAYLAPLEPA